MLSLSVGNAPAELRAAVLAMKQADSEVRRNVAARTRETMNPVWRSEVTQHLAGGVMEGRMLTAGARIAAGNPPQLVAASSSRRIGSGGGLMPSENWAGYEYGASDAERVTHSAKGKAYKRHVMRHLPSRRRNGRVLGPAARAVLPRFASLWVQSVIRGFMDAADGKEG